jgi:uncharacterized SAM-binding protein YcdF (DUF218 family)
MTPQARRLAAVALLLVVALAVASLRLFVWPAFDPPVRADAVLVFAGGDGERQAEGARLVRSGVAPVLVVSNGGDTTSPSARACKPAQDLEVTCLTPPSSSTRSEARAFAGLAERQHWGSVVVVTTTYHLRRARQALRRCYDGAARASPSPQPAISGTCPATSPGNGQAGGHPARSSGNADAGQVPASRATIGATASTSTPRLT